MMNLRQLLFIVVTLLVASLGQSVADPRPEGKRLGNASVQATPPEIASTPSSRLPIIFLPGVAGSQLFNNPPYVPLVSTQLWPVSLFGQRPLLGLTTEGKSVFGANIFVGDILRAGSARFSTLSDTDAYGSVIEFFKARGYEENTDLFTFPYDWRQDNKTHFDALDGKITVAKARTGKEKVILVGHSMGGLIMRAYVLSKPARAATVDTLITMATPYWGSPKVYYAMIKGYTFGNKTVDPEMMKILFQNWPAAYQLLPRERFIVDMRKTRELCPPNRIPITCPPQRLTPPESYVIRYKGFKGTDDDRVLYTETVDNVWTLNRDLVKLAADFHESAGTKENPKLPTGVKLYVIIGHGISTLRGYALRDWEPGLLDRFIGGSYLELETGRKVTMDPYFDDGDGTVPLWGLEISGATATYYVPTKGGEGDFYAGHGSLPKNKTVQAIVGQILDSLTNLDNKPKPPDPSRFPKTSPSLIWEESPDDFRLK